MTVQTDSLRETAELPNSLSEGAWIANLFSFPRAPPCSSCAPPGCSPAWGQIPFWMRRLRWEDEVTRNPSKRSVRCPAPRDAIVEHGSRDMIVVFGTQGGRLSDKAPYNRLGADRRDGQEPILGWRRLPRGRCGVVWRAAWPFRGAALRRGQARCRASRMWEFRHG